MAYGRTTFQPGFREVNGSDLNRSHSRTLQGGMSRQDTITAKAGGTKAAAFPLDNTYNRISVCATANDSVLLPKAIAGSEVTVINSGAANLAVYGAGIDTIDGVATATANVIAPTKAKKYACLTNGAWFTVSAVA